MAKQNAKVKDKAMEATQTIIAGEAPLGERKKKGGNVAAKYITHEGKEVAAMPERPVGIVVRVGKRDDGEMGAFGERTVMFDDLPDATKIRLLAFGAKTSAQNAVNTAETAYDGWEAFQRRFDNFAKDVWSEVGGGGGGGVPLYLQAFRRAAEKAGRPAEEVEAKFQELLAIYSDESGEEKDVTKRRKDLRASLMSKPVIEKAFLELQAEAVAKRQASLKGEESEADQFASLGL